VAVDNRSFWQPSGADSWAVLGSFDLGRSACAVRLFFQQAVKLPAKLFSLSLRNTSGESLPARLNRLPPRAKSSSF
jgi:hypothetical protein